MHCQNCNQPIEYTPTGLVHRDGFRYCADETNRAAKPRLFLVRKDLGVVNFTPFREQIKHTIGWICILGAVYFFRLVSMGVIR